MTTISIPAWQACPLCGTATTSAYCALCVRETPPPLLEAFEVEGEYAVTLRTGMHIDFKKATPNGDFTLLTLSSGTQVYVRISDIVWAKTS